MLALFSTLPVIALADVHYISVSNMERDGAMKPMRTMTTSLKEGLSRLDTKQDLGFYRSAETTISSRASRQRTSYDPNLNALALKSGQKALAELLSAPETGPSTAQDNAE